MSKILYFLGIALMVLGIQPGFAQEQSWKTAWASTLQHRDSQQLVLNGQTVRQTVISSIAGSGVRVRVSNEYGTETLSVGAAAVRVGDGEYHALTFSGLNNIDLPPGSAAISDPVDIALSALAEVEINLFLPGRSATESYQRNREAVGTQISPPGDFTNQAEMPVQAETFPIFLSALEVMTPAEVPGLVVFGDTKSAAPGTWVHYFVDMAQGSWAVANRSFFAGRMTFGGPGENSLSRVDSDVLSVTGVTHALVFQGNNDLIQPGAIGGSGRVMIDPIYALSSEELIAALDQIARQIHSMGIKVVGGTWLPYENAVVQNYWTPEKENKRQAINEWIRNSGVFDRVIDYDAALRDPANPTELAQMYDSGNGFSPNEAGYQLMAELSYQVLADSL